MNKLQFKGRFENSEGVDKLIKVFFENFNPQNSIEVNDNVVKIELIIEETPCVEIITAFSGCVDKELNYKSFSNVNEGIKEKKSKAKAKESKEIKSEMLQMSYLEQIAKRAKSIEDFASLVVKWVGVTKKVEFFEKLIIESMKVEKVNWKHFQETSEWYNVNDKNYIAKIISTKFLDISIIKFLKEVAQYKDYPFPEKNRVKLKCMPEIVFFEEALSKMDKTNPIEERIKYVFELMGLDKLPKNKQTIINDFAYRAIKNPGMNYADMFKDEKIGMDQIMARQGEVSKFVNDFVATYAKDNKKVGMADFFSELRKLLL